MRKAKMAGELSIMGVLSSSSSSPHSSSPGVCTRSRTLALQRGSGLSTAADGSMPTSSSSSSFLQLRSRRLEKETGLGGRGGGVSVRSSKFGKTRAERERVVMMVEVDEKDDDGAEVASWDPAAVKDAQADSVQRITKNDPNTAAAAALDQMVEMEEFFAQVERQQQMKFTRKYNFDIMNDRPLPGRYEWVELDC